MANKVEQQVIVSAIDRVSAPIKNMQSKFAGLNSQLQSLKRQTLAIGKTIGSTIAHLGVFVILARPAGVEPASQPSEGHGLSISLWAQSLIYTLNAQ